MKLLKISMKFFIILFLGPDEYRFKAEIEYNGREVTRKYLEEKCTKWGLQTELENLKTVEDLEEFLLNHGDKLFEKVSKNGNNIFGNYLNVFFRWAMRWIE